MVLVRRSELACRSDWANDLWEPKAGVEPVSISSSPRYTSEAGKSDDRRQYTDRVTAVSVAPSRTSHEETVSVAPRLEAAKQVEEVRDETRGVFDDEPESEPIAPEPTGSRYQSRAGDSDEAEDRSRFDVRRDLLQPNPVADRVEPSASATSDRSVSRDEREGSRERPAAQPRRDDLDSRSWALPSREAPPRPRDTGTERSTPATPAPEPPARRSFGDEPATRFGAPPARVAETRPTQPDRSPRTPMTEDPATDPLPRGRSGWTEPFAVSTPSSSPAAQPAVRAEAAPVIVDETRAIDPAPVPAPPLKPPVSARHSTMKECCGTCRDFRPAEGGERGWCNNPYAFDHRQMVEKNDLACRSTIGSWWIASDDWWMHRADITHHGRPTPIVDDLLRQLLNSRAQRRVSRG